MASRVTLTIGNGKPKVNLIYHNKHPSQCAACHAAYPFDEEAFYHRAAEELKVEIDRVILEDVRRGDQLEDAWWLRPQ